MSLHQAASPTFVQILGGLDGVLAKARAHCEAGKIDPTALLQFRLYPDMFPLVRQVQSATDHAAGSCLRLALKNPALPPRDEASFEALQHRIAGAIEIVRSIGAGDMDANADRVLTIKAGARSFEMTGRAYMLHHAFPNFYFHVTTAYDILRHNGVVIGKRDFMGVVPGLAR